MKRLNVVIKNNLRVVSVDVEDWEQMTKNRSSWRTNDLQWL